MRTTLNLQSLGDLIHGVTPDPGSILGPHRVHNDGRQVIAVRSFLPDASQVWLVDPRGEAIRPMRRVHPSGLYEGLLPDYDSPSPSYRLRVSNSHGQTFDMQDPYSVPTFLSDYDRFLFGSGRHWKLYEKLGAHLRSVDGHEGVNFAVWAPNAQSVQVVGDRKSVV